MPPGSERDAIRRGYARKLKTVHPEDDPEGFKALREAYDQALQEAEWAARYGDDYHEEDEEEAFADDGASDAGDAGEYARGWHTRDTAPVRDGAEDAFAVEDERDAAAFDAILRDFAERLDSDAAPDPDGLIAAFDAIVASPVMDGISARGGVEAWLAEAIADAIPRSDPLIVHAIRTFGWDDNDHRRTNDWHLGRIMRRIEEWDFIADAQIAGSEAHLGWRALTGPPLPNWRMRLLAWSATQRAQVRRILERTRYDMPGLRHHFTPEGAAWWEAFEGRAHHTIGTLLLAPLVLWLVDYVAGALSNDAAVEGYATLLGIPLALVAPTLWVRLVKKRQLGWMQGDIDPPPRWFATGWMPAAVALPLAAMLLPGDAVGIGIAFVLSALLVLWITIALPPAQSLVSRVSDLALRLWGPFIFWGTFSFLDGPHGHIQTAVSAAILVVWLRGCYELLHMLNNVVARLFVPATYWAIPALIGIALLVHAALPATPLFFLAGMAVVLGWPLLMLHPGTEPQVKGFVRSVMWFALFGFYLFSIPQVSHTPRAAVTCPPGQIPDQSGDCAVGMPVLVTPPLADATKTPAPPAPVPEAVADKVADARKLLVLPPERVVPKPKRARCKKDTRTVPGPPKPCGSVSDWIVSSDYPVAALSQDRRGATKADLSIDDAGNITDCEVTKSSGTASLDEATCSLMRSRGRYLPGRTEDGPAPSTVRMTFTWDLET